MGLASKMEASCAFRTTWIPTWLASYPSPLQEHSPFYSSTGHRPVLAGQDSSLEMRREVPFSEAEQACAFRAPGPGLAIVLAFFSSSLVGLVAWRSQALWEGRMGVLQGWGAPSFNPNVPPPALQP